MKCNLALCALTGLLKSELSSAAVKRALGFFLSAEFLMTNWWVLNFLDTFFAKQD